MTSATILFSDMAGSTELATARGDEVAIRAVRVHQTAAQQAASETGGRVIKSTGDGFLIAHAEPAAGIACAFRMLDLINAQNEVSDDPAVGVRFGIHSGPVIEEHDDLYGLAVNATARIVAKAEVGQVLVSDDVRQAVASSAPRSEGSSVAAWSFADRGLFWLKGLREQWRLYEASDGRPASGSSRPVESRARFIDREEERAQLRSAVDRAAEGKGGIVLVHGSIGSGKSRLTEEVGTEARSRGLRFVVSRGHEDQRDQGYSVWVGVIDALEKAVDAATFAASVGTNGDALARINPRLEALAATRHGGELPPEAEQRLVSRGVVDLLSSLAALRPTVVLLDDLHWSDASSLALLTGLADELEAVPLLIIGTYRTEEVDGWAPLQRALSTLHRDHRVSTIALAPLGRDHVADLVAAVCGAPVDGALLDQLYATTGGNPFFVEALARDLVDRNLSAASSTGDVEQFVSVPESVRLAIRSKLSRLSPDAQRMLHQLCLITNDFGFDVLEPLAGLAEDDLLDALDETERARVFVSRNEGPGVRFSFAHELVRQVLASELSAARRQWLHLRVAEAMEAAYAGHLAEHAATIAHHLQRAGDQVDTEHLVSVLLVAGERALESASFDEGLAHLRRAFALVGPPHPRRAELLEQMGRAERSLGNLNGALALWREALDLHAAAGDRAAEAGLCLRAALQVALWRRGDELRALIDRGLRASAEDFGPTRAGLLALAGSVATQQVDYERGAALLNDAIALSRRQSDPTGLGLTLYLLGAHHFSFYEYPEVVAAGRESIPQLRAAGDQWNLANTLGYTANALGWMGHYAEAAELGQEAEALALRLRNWSAYVFADAAQAFLDIGSHPAPDAMAARGERVLELGDELEFRWLRSVGHSRLGVAAFWRGDWGAALAEFEVAAELEPAQNASGGHLGRLLLVHAYMGHGDEALRLIDECRPGFPVLGRPNPGTAWTLAATAVEAFAMLGLDDDAAELLDTVLAHRSVGPLLRSWDYRLLPTLAGVAAGCGQQWERAESFFDEAAATADALPHRLERPEIDRFRAAMLLRRNEPGDLARAVTLLGDAGRGYDQLGMRGHRALVDRMLAGVPTAAQPS